MVRKQAFHYNEAFLYLKQTISYQETLYQKQKQNFTPLTAYSQLHQDTSLQL